MTRGFGANAFGLVYEILKIFKVERNIQKVEKETFRNIISITVVSEWI